RLEAPGYYWDSLTTWQYVVLRSLTRTKGNHFPSPCPRWYLFEKFLEYGADPNITLYRHRDGRLRLTSSAGEPLHNSKLLLQNRGSRMSGSRMSGSRMSLEEAIDASRGMKKTARLQELIRRNKSIIAAGRGEIGQYS